MTARHNPAETGAGITANKSAKTIPGGQMAGDQASPEVRREAHLHLGDELPAGTPGAGENICRGCNGSGSVDGHRCELCGGTGKVIESVAGGP